MPKEKAKSKPVNGTGPETFDRGAIEKLAYEFWLSRGCPQGSAEEDWIQAERALQIAASTNQPIPASSGKTAGKTGSAMRAAG
jgi:hypothetical protein